MTDIVQTPYLATGATLLEQQWMKEIRANGALGYSFAQAHTLLASLSHASGGHSCSYRASSDDSYACQV